MTTLTDKQAAVEAALDVIQQDYGPDARQMASPREYVVDAVVQLARAGLLRQPEAAPADGDAGHSRTLLSALAIGIGRWARDEDGVPDYLHAAYREAKKALSGSTGGGLVEYAHRRESEVKARGEYDEFRRMEAEESASAAPSPTTGEWYCAQCQRTVDGKEVTFNEQHEVCGRVITNDAPPARPAQPTPEPSCNEAVAWRWRDKRTAFYPEWALSHKRTADYGHPDNEQEPLCRCRPNASAEPRGLRALEEAATSLETISKQAGRDEYMQDMQQVRGYANSRAVAARACLDAITHAKEGENHDRRHI